MSFKIYFQANSQQELPDVRRLGMAIPPPNFESFCLKLSELFPGKYHPELLVQYNDEEGDFITVTSEVEWQEALSLMENEKLKKFYIRNSNGPYFKDTVFAPETKYFYETSNDNDKKRRRCRKGKISSCVRRDHTEDARLKNLSEIVPRVLGSLFEGGKILPFAGFPEWLKPVVRVQRTGSGIDAELDINVDAFARVLFTQGLACLEAGKTEEAKKIYEGLVQLEPAHSSAWYNLACCESILAEKLEDQSQVTTLLTEGLVHLKNALDHGFNNINHYLTDPDLKFIRTLPAFQTLIDMFNNTKKTSVPSPNFGSFGIVMDNNQNNNNNNNSVSTTTPIPASVEVDENNNNVSETKEQVEDEEKKAVREQEEAAFAEHQKWLAEEEAKAKLAEQKRIEEEEEQKERELEQQIQAEQLRQLAEQMQNAAISVRAEQERKMIEEEEERRRLAEEEEEAQKRREEEQQQQQAALLEQKKHEEMQKSIKEEEEQKKAEQEAKQQEQQQKKKDEEKSHLQRQLDQLADMGFNDVERNTELLKAFRGDLAEVLQVLLG